MVAYIRIRIEFLLQTNICLTDSYEIHLIFVQHTFVVVFFTANFVQFADVGLYALLFIGLERPEYPDRRNSCAFAAIPLPYDTSRVNDDDNRVHDPRHIFVWHGRKYFRLSGSEKKYEIENRKKYGKVPDNYTHPYKHVCVWAWVGEKHAVGKRPDACE